MDIKVCAKFYDYSSSSSLGPKQMTNQPSDIAVPRAMLQMGAYGGVQGVYSI